jgi:hypothetical protein
VPNQKLFTAFKSFLYLGMPYWYATASSNNL